ncbi:MAG TPA: hypothetical protein VGE72_16345, partial [Azospirillum sp.]
LLGLTAQAVREAEGAAGLRALLDTVDALPPVDVRAIKLRLLGVFERLRSAPDLGTAEDALRRLADARDPRAPLGHWDAALRRFADGFDRLRERFPAFLVDSGWRRESAEAVTDRILDAHRAGRPLSLIRLGDGEGNFLPYPAGQEEHAEPDRNATQCIWWGAPRLDRAAAEGMTAALGRAVRNADIVGVPDLSRLCYGLPLPTPPFLFHSWHDYRGLLVILHHLALRGDGALFSPAQTITSCHIHADLAAWGQYERLLGAVGRVSLVTCHPTLPAVLTRRFGVAVAQVHQIPHEAKYAAQFGYADRGAHYPDAFHALERTLAVREPGEVFLVAAGFLGKMYCDWIKARGGIALDVGSVVDHWCGFSTRSAHFVQRYAAAPEPAAPEPAVLVLTPVKNARRHLPDFLAMLERLDYPRDRLSLGFLEGDSDDGSHAWLEAELPRLRGLFRRVVLARHDLGLRLDGPRWAPEVQRPRRAAIARARNRLLSAALTDEDWVLWVDADVVGAPPDALRRLLAAGRDIVVPHCVLDPGGPTFDLNSFQITDTGAKARHVVDGLVQPPRGAGRRYLADLRGRGRGQEPVPLDGVGGTMLLVRADLHREGLVFPPFPYRGYIETEGLAMMARDMGVACWGLPDLEIVHARD